MNIHLWNQTLPELLQRGGIVMWPLLLCSVTAFALAIDRLVAHLRVRLDYRQFIGTLRPMVAAGRTTEAISQWQGQRGPIARAAEAYLRNLGVDDTTRAGIVEREGSEALEAIEKRQRGLSVVAHIATLLGLLGTVAGLVSAFHQIELAGGQVEPSDLAAGIWEALLTTVFGLSIAIPSFVAYHLCESRADRIARRMSFTVSYLDQWLGKHTAGHAAAAEPGEAVAGIREE
jgi:biopolymer transport protein ExbB